jgi:hypothetical protein
VDFSHSTEAFLVDFSHSTEAFLEKQCFWKVGFLEDLPRQKWHCVLSCSQQSPEYLVDVVERPFIALLARQNAAP